MARIHRRTIQKKIFMTQITMGVANSPPHTHTISNHDGVINHLEPDILECEVKWALGSITINQAGGDNGIPAKLFQILKDHEFRVLHSISQ